MVVAWLTSDAMENEIDAYTTWDRRASKTERWTLISFARSARESYFRQKKNPEDPDLIEYHWVLADLEAHPVTELRSINSP